MDTHNLLTLQYAFVKGHIHISNSNKLRDFTHATLSPYGKHHACPHTTAYNVPDDPHSVQLGTQQQWQQFLMTTYMTSLCSRHSTQRPPDCSLSAWQMCTPHGCTERDWHSLKQIAISGAVLGPVHVVAHASTAAWNQICFEVELRCFKNEPRIVFCLLIGSVWTHRSKYTYAGRRVKKIKK